MTTLLEKSQQALPITEMSRSAKRIIDDFQKGEQTKYVVMRNNVPAAIMMSISYYEELNHRIEELHDELIILQRMKNFDVTKSVSHEEMTRRFELNS